MIDTYGADTARWFMLSDSPPDRDLEWTETGVAASHKFINKIWELVEKSQTYSKDETKTAKEHIEKFDKIINDISSQIEEFHFNKSVAKIYEYVNLLSSLMAKNDIIEKELSTIIRNLKIIINTFIPNISKEIQHTTRNSGFCALASGQKTKKEYNTQLVKRTNQNNGKKRSLINVLSNEEENFVIKKILDDPKIIKYINNKEIIKTIFIKNKIVNFVIK